MACKHIQSFFYVPKHQNFKRIEAMHLSFMFYHPSEEPREKNIPPRVYDNDFAEITKLSHSLKNVDLVDGRLININDSSSINDDDIEYKMHTFKSFGRALIGSPSVQHALKRNVRTPQLCFSKTSEREAMSVNSLTKVCNFLKVSAQQRKVVRFTICQQVTEHRVWIGTLNEILNGLKNEIDILNHRSPTKQMKMGDQIVVSCLKFLADASISYDPDSTSWMRLTPVKSAESSCVAHKWEDVLEMFNHLIKCLKSEKRLSFHISKLEVMKEGLFQIRDVLVDKSIGYRETRHQESLVQKKLSKTLGHSSQCLFTLLQYYLYQSVRDIEVEISGGVYGSSGDRFWLYMGKILTSDDEKMVCVGVKQLDRALGLFKFVWEIAHMKGALELQGHLWCVGAEHRTLVYRGNTFFIHGISR